MTRVEEFGSPQIRGRLDNTVEIRAETTGGALISLNLEAGMLRDLYVGLLIVYCSRIGIIPNINNIRELTEEESKKCRHAIKSASDVQRLREYDFDIEELLSGCLYTLSNKMLGNKQLVITETDLYYIEHARIKLRNQIIKSETEYSARAYDMDDSELLDIGMKYMPRWFFEAQNNDSEIDDDIEGYHMMMCDINIRRFLCLLILETLAGKEKDIDASTIKWSKRKL